MSCDWDVYCLDCKESHGFYDANHELPLMRQLIALAPAIAAMHPAYEKLGLEICFSNNRLRLHPDFFAKHATHSLVARNEYGDCDDECGKCFPCETCGDRKTCTRPKDHEGACSILRDDGKS